MMAGPVSFKTLECHPVDSSSPVTLVTLWEGSNCGDTLYFHKPGYSEGIQSFNHVNLDGQSDVRLISEEIFLLNSIESFNLPLNGGIGHVVKRHWNSDIFHEIDFENPELEDIQVECRPL